MRLLFIFIFISSVAFAKEKSNEFIFTAKIVEYNESKKATVMLDSAVVSLYVDSVCEANLVSKQVQTKKPVSLSLPMDKNFLVGMGKKGYVTKWIAISTKDIPAKRQKEPFSEFSIELDLFKKYSGIDYSILDQPLSTILYNPDPSVDELDLVRNEIYPVSQLKALKQQVHEKEIEYQKHIQLADSLYTAKSWNKALESYKAAASIMPGDPYSGKQIVLCEQKSEAELKEKH